MRALLLGVTAVAACGDGAQPAEPPQQKIPRPSAPFALVMVVNNQEIFVGNDQFELDENARYAGAFGAIGKAVEANSLASLLPRGSIGAVIGYSTGVEVLVPMGPIANVPGTVFTDQARHRGNIGTDLVEGMTRGMLELLAVRADRRMMIVIGDGNDTNNEAARERVLALRDLAGVTNVVIAPILWRSHCYRGRAGVFNSAGCAQSSDGFGGLLHRALTR